MNAVVPHHNLNAKEKKSIVSANQKLYKKAPKKIKSLMLNDLQCITGYSRKYIIFSCVHMSFHLRCFSVLFKNGAIAYNRL